MVVEAMRKKKIMPIKYKRGVLRVGNIKLKYLKYKLTVSRVEEGMIPT